MSVIKFEPWIYFVAMMDEGKPVAIKIGYSTTPESRLGNLQVGSPFKVEIAVKVHGTRDDEEALHHRFKGLHMRGEWFRPEPRLIDFIRDLRANPTTELMREKHAWKWKRRLGLVEQAA